MFRAKHIFFILFTLFFLFAKAQTVTGFLSILQTASPLGCGCTGCNDAAFIATQTYPDPEGGCGTTEPSANSGGCATLSKTRTIVIPAACTVNVTGCMQDRGASCTGSTHGPGMDGGDQFSIVGTGGTVNGNSGVQTGASNAQVCASIVQVGGQIAFNLTANRVAELLTYTITYTGAGCLPNPLPVELIYFSVDKTEGELNLTWATATERNSLNFDVEYSFDAVKFNKVTSVEAAGESNQILQYHQLIPDTFKTEILYLRLKHNDRDGTYSYSPIIYVVSNAVGNFKISPNPTETGEINILLNDKVRMPATLEILDYTGVKINETDLEFPTTKINLNQYPKGLYFLKIKSGDKTTTHKVISH